MSCGSLDKTPRRDIYSIATKYTGQVVYSSFSFEPLTNALRAQDQQAQGWGARLEE